MNSSPVLDSAAGLFAAMVPAEAKLAAPKDGGAEFGEALAEASAEVEETEDEEKKEPKAETVVAVPFAFFFPPPEIKPLPKLEIETTVGVSLEGETGSDEAGAITAANGQEGANILETVQPKAQTIKEGKIPLEGFESVTPELVEVAQVQMLKGSDNPPLADVEDPRGTVAAEQANVMKNGQKSAEFAPAIEQKMPVREQVRRFLPEQARFETAALIADAFAQAKMDFQVEAPARDFSVRTIDTVQLIETIRTEVTQLRQRGDSTVTVVLKPDSGTELKLELSVARDGTIHANARCERGNFQTLSAQWPQLQQALAAQGIRVNDLANSSGLHQHNESAHGQAFDRGNNSQQQQQQPQANFDEELTASTPRVAKNKMLTTAAAPTRRWQSWA